MVFLVKRISLFVLVAIAGCATIERARNAQEAVAPYERDDYVQSSGDKLDLSGYSLSQLVDFAMTNRPSVKVASLAVKDARLAMQQIRADAPLVSSTPWFSPRIEASGGYSASSESVGSLGDLSAKTYGDPSASLSLSLPIWDFGRHDAKISAQTERVLAAELKLLDEGYYVFYEVCNSYFTLLEKCALLEVAHTNENEFALHLEQAQKRFEEGETQRLDCLRAQLDLAKAKEDTVSAEKDVNMAGADFLRALGIDASHGTRRDVLDFPGDALSFAMRGFPDTDYTVQEAFELARTNAPAVRLARANLRGASADVDYAVADLLPEINASVSLNWTDPLWYWKWGGSGVQSLFRGFSKVTAVDRAVVALESSAAELEKVEQQLSLDIVKAVAYRDNSRKARATAAEALDQARENLKMVNEQYQLGEASQVEFTDAVADYVREMGNRISAFYKGQRSECAIFSLVGIYPIYEEKKLTEELK